MSSILESRQVLAFATLARCRSFTQTAKELNLTQSAISHTIKALEQEVGVALFERVGKRVFLTQAGEWLLPSAERILGEMVDARAALETVRAWGRGRLRVGASVTTCQYLLPTVLREFRQSFPDCTISIQTGDVDRMSALLQQNEVDLALMLETGVSSTMGFLPLFEDEICVLVSPMHAWASAKLLSAEHLNSGAVLAYNKSSHTFALIMAHLESAGMKPAEVIELGSMEAIKELAKVSVGAGMLAPWTAERELAEGALISLPMPGGRLWRKWGVAYLKGRRLTLAEETFAGLCESVAQTLNQACDRRMVS